MVLDTLLDEIRDRLSENEYFKDVKIIEAYPDAVKPTRLGRVHIALGISEIRLTSSRLDSSERAGEVILFADIFVPVGIERNMSEIFSELCKALSTYNVLSISASRISTDRDIQARVLKTTISFSDELSFGGEAQ